jgi:ribose 5-phosphate isomerase B
MRVHLGSDHAGFELKAFIAARLRDHGHVVVDHGATDYHPEDDYPSFCIAAAQGAVADPGALAIVIGGSGNGEQIAANKVPGARAALVWNEETARLAREHNDANVAGIGARMHDPDTAFRIVEAFLDTPFSHGERHVRRIAEIAAFERGEHPRSGA